MARTLKTILISDLTLEGRNSDREKFTFIENLKCIENSQRTLKNISLIVNRRIKYRSTRKLKKMKNTIDKSHEVCSFRKARKRNCPD